MVEETKKEKQVGIILLAAGGSSRLGRPKQLLQYKGKTLLQYSVEEALASEAGTVIVVLGAEADTLQKEINEYKIHIVINQQWQEGMASSIRTGIDKLLEIHPSAEGAILQVSDQPFMTAGLLNTLLEVHHNTNKGIVTCSYGNTFGPPVFFHRSFFSELLQLKGDVGARSIVQQHTDDVAAIAFPAGVFDIDTNEDYESLKNTKP